MNINFYSTNFTYNKPKATKSKIMSPNNASLPKKK